MIGKQTTSASRTRKQSTVSSTNRNKSLIDSVKSPDITPSSSVVKQPAGSSNNRISSIDRANSRIGSVISPKRTPPPNAAQQPAASLNNRISSSKSRGIGSSISKQANTTSRIRKQTPSNPGNRGNSRTDDTISKRTSSVSITREVSGTREPTISSRTKNPTNGGRANRKTNPIESGTQSSRANNDIKQRVSDERSDRSRLRKVDPDNQTTINNNTIINTRDQTTSTRVHRYDTARPSRLIYRDRPYLGRDYYHYEHTYVDYYSRLRRRIIWPRFRFMLCYNRGPWFSFRYFYPYYHRKYVFVSLGGYWPAGYGYSRYYWYGCHPYYWYGYYPIAREVQGETYNYYTYNYYYGDDGQTYEPSQVVGPGYYDNLAQQPVEEPAQATLADSYFEEAVKAFEASNYGIAIDKFSKAIELAPDDMVLPFAYCQALLAAEQYSAAAQVLRAALKKIRPEKEGVFYPRGLYPNEEILLAQLDSLAEKAEIFSFDADLQLLLGYQLLGIGELDKAVTPLMNSGRDLKNSDAAAVLLRLLEKIKTSEDNKEEAETEGVKFKDTGTSQSPVQGKIINKGNATRTKGTVLLATLCVLAGSTGIGHYFRV